MSLPNIARPISFDLLSGLRRGELLGLRWSDVDFENETVTIVQTSSYVPGVGDLHGHTEEQNICTASEALALCLFRSATGTGVAGRATRALRGQMEGQGRADLYQ